VNDLLVKILMLGMTKEQGKGALIFIYRFAVMFGIGAGWGWFTYLGIPRFAIAADTQASIMRTEAAVTIKLDRTVELLNKTLAAGISAQIRSQALKRCGGKPDEREAANREIDRLQEEYRQYKAERYDIPECGNL
jgi:hypothetical protein